MSQPGGNNRPGQTRKNRGGRLFRLALAPFLLASIVSADAANPPNASFMLPPAVRAYMPAIPPQPHLLKRQHRPLRLFLQAPSDLLKTAHAAANQAQEPWSDVLSWLRADADMAFQGGVVGIWDENTGPGEAAWNDFVSLAPWVSLEPSLPGERE